MPDSKSGTSRWEWAAAGLSALLVLSAMGHTGYQALAGPDTPPVLVVQVDSVYALGPGRGYVVHVRARNSGGETAAAVTLRGEIVERATAVETAEVTVDYIPAGGSRGAALMFTRDPRRFELELRAVGFGSP